MERSKFEKVFGSFDTLNSFVQAEVEFERYTTENEEPSAYKWKLIRPNEELNIKDGFYLTKRISLGGRIRNYVNEWRDNKWQDEMADGGFNVAYRDITDEDLKKFYNYGI